MSIFTLFVSVSVLFAGAFSVSVLKNVGGGPLLKTTNLYVFLLRAILLTNFSICLLITSRKRVSCSNAALL